MSKKQPAKEDDLPRCDQCRAGVFGPGEREGECRLLPMQWISVGDDAMVARHNLAVADGWCAHFNRRTH